MYKSDLTVDMEQVLYNRSTLNPMDKGAYNSVHYQYCGWNSNMAPNVIMYIIGYIILSHNRDILNGLLSIISCESSAVSTLKDCHKLKVKSYRE